MARIPSPFPYYGGKSRWCDVIWDRFGEVVTYVEPFAGTFAVGLGCPFPAAREIMGDTHAAICNIWRSIVLDPVLTAMYACYPTIHQDLTARHRWLVQWYAENHHLFDLDPNFYNSQAAGWWCWGIANWIGGNFCDYKQMMNTDKRPYVSGDDTGQGVQSQRKFSDQVPALQMNEGGRGVQTRTKTFSDKVPHVKPHDGGLGIQNQRKTFNTQIPHIRSDATGQGVQMTRTRFPDQRPLINTDDSGKGVQSTRKFDSDEEKEHIDFIIDWFHALQKRLERTVVINRSWESLVTPKMLGTDPNIAVFMDPPYMTAKRHASLYHTDSEGTSDDVAIKSWNWCVEHGEKIKIAYACHEGDFELPDGWTSETLSFGGIHGAKDRTQDMVMFSPMCRDIDSTESIPLFEGT